MKKVPNKEPRTTEMIVQIRFPPKDRATTPVAIAVRLTFPTNQTFPRSLDFPKRSECGTQSTLRVSTSEGARAFSAELINTPSIDTHHHLGSSEASRKNKGKLTEKGEVISEYLTFFTPEAREKFVQNM
jgi:hypothetical protein